MQLKLQYNDPSALFSAQQNLLAAFMSIAKSIICIIAWCLFRGIVCVGVGQVYMKMYGEWTRVQGWTAGVGAGLDTGGWHCSWCVDPERIRVKLMSAHNGDFPRWGDYPAKLNTTYIRGLIKRGLWFNDVTKLKRYDDVSGPPSLFANRNRYWTLIHNVYEDSS